MKLNYTCKFKYFCSIRESYEKKNLKNVDKIQIINYEFNKLQ